jgi:hypothetical protein
MPTSKRPDASWSDLKAKLAALDRSELIALVRDLCAASKENQAFLHTRLGVGGDVLKPYVDTIERWLSPDVFRGQDVSVAKAKKAVAEYRKAQGQPQGLAELAVCFCERASGFAAEVGMDDESYLGALVRMFEQALKAVAALDEPQRAEFLARLDLVRQRRQHIGYGVGDDVNDLWTQHGQRDSACAWKSG